MVCACVVWKKEVERECVSVRVCWVERISGQKIERGCVCMPEERCFGVAVMGDKKGMCVCVCVCRNEWSCTAIRHLLSFIF